MQTRALPSAQLLRVFAIVTAGNVLLSVAQMRRADHLAVATGTSLFDLMRAAGCKVADAATALVPEGPILVVAGLGNNGGDGFIAAGELRRNGRDVRVMLLGARDALTGDAARAALEWKGPWEAAEPEAIGQPALIIDAMFGAGLNRDIEGPGRRIIEAINASNAKILSVDLPSGINGDSGVVMGIAVRATRTVTFFRRKPGHLLMPGRAHCGAVCVADIGIADEVLRKIAPQTFHNDPALWRHAFPTPEIDGHKYSRGHAVVLSGPATATGAARLAARGALRAGAGLVTVASPADALPINAAALTAVMVRLADSPEAFGELLADRRINCAVIGPGAGVSGNTRACVLAALAPERGIVLDADALTSFADAPQQLFERLSGCRAVLTPHQGEYRRLFRSIADDPNHTSKLDRARAAAAPSRAVIVLKGPDTVVAAPDGRASIADNAPPWLATAGSGDVLAGIVAGLLAQRVEAFEAACIGVWLHGEAAGQFGPGLIAEDLPEALPAVLRKLMARIDDQATTR